MEEPDSYNKSYFTRRGNLSYESAQKTLEILSKYFSFDSVVDFGCGTGTWLKVCLELGCLDVLGIDRHADGSSELEIPSNKFLKKSLAENILLEKRYDFAICLEAAEHLEAEFANTIVENLVNASDLILFSAAIPGQGGTNHQNEQPPDYWREKFSSHGYVQLDCIRPTIWEEPKIAWWYKQNAFLYLSPQALGKHRDIGCKNFMTNKHLVHPDCFQAKLLEHDLVNASIPNLLKAIIRKLGKKFQQFRED
jgi:hypothetical protein